MPDMLEQVIERYFRRIEQELRGFKAEGDDEAMRKILKLLQQHVTSLDALYYIPPPPPVERVLTQEPVKWRNRTFGSNF